MPKKERNWKQEIPDNTNLRDLVNGNCGNCWKCKEEQVNANPGLIFVIQDMTACPECGNKRCPKASDHRNNCTGSNEPGQEGSIY